jgi:PAS domain S-box-containing protein
MKNRHFVLAGVAFALCSWLLETAIHVFVFQTGSFAYWLFPGDTNEVWMRLVIITLFIIFGWLAQRCHDAKARVMAQAHASDARYCAIFDSIDDVYYRAGLEGGIIDISPSCFRHTGYKPEEIIGQPITHFYVDPDQRSDFMQRLRQKGRINDYEVSLRHKNGSSIIVSVTSRFITDDENRPVAIEGILRNITERMQAAEALKENKARYRMLVDNMPDGIVVHCDGKIVFANHSAGGMLAPDQPDELIGKPVMEFVHSDFRKKVRKRIRRALELGETQPLAEERMLRLDGSEFIACVSGTPVRYGDRPAVQTVFRDITARKQVETKLRQSLASTRQAETAALNMMEDADAARKKLEQIQKRHKEAQRIARLGHWEIDLVNDKLAWSDETCRIFGLEPGASIAGESFLKVVHPDDHDFVKSAYAESVQNRTDYNIEHRLLMQDGSIKWVNERCVTEYAEDGAPLRSIGTVQDITQHKQMEMLVQGENHVLELLSSGRPKQDVLNAMNLLVEANVPGSFSSILLLDENGKRLLAGSAPSLPEAFNAAIDGVAIGPGVGSCGTAAYRDETVIVGDIATDPLWSDFRDLALAHGLEACWSVPIHSSSGSVVGTFAIYHGRPCMPDAGHLKLLGTVAHICGIAIEHWQVETELTHHRDHLEKMVRQRTQELEIARDRAQSSNRAKSTFLANMSHELRTPLNSILGFSELLSLDKTHPLQAEQQTHLGFIMESGNRLLNLINDLLDMSKIEAGKMEMDIEMFDVRVLINHVLKYHAIALDERNIKVRTYCADDIGLCRGDMRKIHQVLDNLMSNAMKFTPAGGAITLKAQWVNPGACPIQLTRADTDARDLLKINVTDSGIGIRAEDQGKLFEPFQQLDGELNRQYEGTGLGLSLCRKIIQMHGGGIWLEQSEPGQGSTFAFVIPAGEAES